MLSKSPSWLRLCLETPDVAGHPTKHQLCLASETHECCWQMPKQAGVVADIVLLACVGIRPVLVHGGGPEINSWLEKVGIEPNFKNGLRVTDGKQHPTRRSQ